MDCASRQILTDKLKYTSTATVTAKLNSWFPEYGYPEYIRTDGSPQFRRDFKAYCDSITSITS